MGNIIMKGMLVNDLHHLTFEHPQEKVINKALLSPALNHWLGGQVQEPAPAPTPAPAPAPAPEAPPVQVTETSSPAILIIEDLVLYTVNGQLGAITPPIQSFSIAGNATQTTYIHRTVSSEFRKTFSSSALDSSSEAASKTITEDVRSASETSSATDTFDYSLDSSVHVRGEVGLNSAKGDASLRAKTSSTAVHDAAREAAEAAVQKQVSSTRTAVSQQTVQANSSSAQLSTEDSVQSLTIDNSKNPQSITYGICRISIEKVTALCLTGIRLGLYSARERKTYIFPLEELDGLVQDAIADPENRAKVKEAIVKWVSKPVIDCNKEPRSFVKPIESDGTTILVDDVDARTEVKIPRTDGTTHSVWVPGIALSKRYRVMPTDIVGAAKLVMA